MQVTELEKMHFTQVVARAAAFLGLGTIHALTMTVTFFFLRKGEANMAV